MAHKEVREEEQKRGASAISPGVVPVKVERPQGKDRSLLSLMQFELSHLNYTAAGSVTRAELSVKILPVEAGVSVGALDLEYNSQPLFFMTPRLSFTYPGEHLELYMEETGAIVFGGGKTDTTVFPYFTAGAVVEPVKPGEHGGFGLQLGLELQYTADAVSSILEYPLTTTEAGAAVTFEPVTIYATEKVFFEMEHPYDEYDERLLIPRHQRVGAGVMLSLEGAKFGAEFGWGKIETEVRFDFSAETKYVQPTISVYGKKRNYGLGNEAGFVLSLDFGAKRKVGTARFEQAFGSPGGGWSETRNLDTESWEPGLDAAAGGGIALPPGGLHTGKDHPGPTGALEKFNSAIRGSDTLDEFIEAYEGASFFEKLYAAWALIYHGDKEHSTGNRGYVEDLAVEGTYGVIRENYIGENSEDTGSCANYGSLAAEFLRKSGLEAYGIAFFDKKNGEYSGHMVTILRNPDKGRMYLLDYKGIMEYKGNSTWPLMQAYAAENGLLLHRVRIYGDDNKVAGVFEGPEENLIGEAAAQRSRSGLKRRFLKRREKEQERIGK